MVNDVAYDSLKIPGFITSMVMKVLSKQIQSKVNFDILKLKPAEFARTCTVPCVFIIGKNDKLVYPKRVLEIFDAYLGKQKSLIHSSGDHTSEREGHILKQCYNFMIQELKKNTVHSRSTMAKGIRFADNCDDQEFSSFSSTFLHNYPEAMKSNTGKNYGLYNAQPARFNFDVYLDETRNEENVAKYDEYRSGTSMRRATGIGKFDNYSSSQREFTEEELLEDLTNLQMEPGVEPYTKEKYVNQVNEISRFMHKNRF